MSSRAHPVIRHSRRRGGSGTKARMADVGDINRKKPAVMRRLATTDMNGVAKMRKTYIAIGVRSVLQRQKRSQSNGKKIKGQA